MEPLFAFVGITLLAVLIVALVVVIARHREATRRAEEQHARERDALSRDRLTAQREAARIREKYAAVISVDEEADRVRAAIEARKAEFSEATREAVAKLKVVEDRKLEAQSDLRSLLAEVRSLREEADFQEVGVYEPHFDFDTSARYKAAIEDVRKKQKAMVKAGKAAEGLVEVQMGGSKRAGGKMVRDRLKLMLRAFNGEADAAISNVRYNNYQTMENRITKARTQINKLSEQIHCVISDEYLELKVAELQLVHEYREKRQAEAEEQRRIREQMREEARAQKEIEKAMRDAEREESRYDLALQQAREEVEAAEGAKRDRLQAKLAELEQRLAEARENKERAVSRAQMTRSGHVYVISNVGSFGEDVYKIGMTRRLEPMDRVRELGDASVPFHFDVHAIIYSEDAPTLEAELHRRFHDRRVNKVNHRKEFFRAPLAEIERVVSDHHGEIEFTRVAEAQDYRQTLALIKQAQSAAGGDGAVGAVA